MSGLPPIDGVIGRPSLWIVKRFWVLRFRLMVKRGPWLRPQASEGEAQHGPFCWIGWLSIDRSARRGCDPVQPFRTMSPPNLRLKSGGRSQVRRATLVWLLLRHGRRIHDKIGSKSFLSRVMPWDRCVVASAHEPAEGRHVAAGQPWPSA
jgi:hypothetical protein